MRYGLLLTVFFALAAGPLRAGSPAAGLPSSASETVPSIALTDMQGHAMMHALRREVTVLMFFSTRCPISNAFNFRRNQLYSDFKGRVRFLVVDPNANEPLAEVRQYAKDVGFDFPVYKDENNIVADRLGVRATTDTLVIDAAGATRYRGYIEDSPNATRARDLALRNAIQDVLAQRPVHVAETHAIGCAIRRVKP